MELITSKRKYGRLVYVCIVLLEYNQPDARNLVLRLMVVELAIFLGILNLDANGHVPVGVDSPRRAIVERLVAP